MPLPHGLGHGHQAHGQGGRRDWRQGNVSLLAYTTTWLRPSIVFTDRFGLPKLQLIKAGEGIIASNQSANRDEDVFTDADKFDMHRKWPREDPLGFGFGPHRCIAEHLAKTELTSVFGAWPFVQASTLRGADCYVARISLQGVPRPQARHVD